MPDTGVPEGRPRARSLGVWPGVLPTGRLNAITDVPGVRVGQVTVWHGEGPLVPGRGPARTGVTVVLPHDGNLWRQPVTASAHVINGFGKPLGLVQVRELGVLESPIALTNTLNVPRVADALIDDALAQTPEIGVRGPTFNPVVLECNDGYLNDIQGRHVTAAHVAAALAQARSPQGRGPVAEGAVGAGTGMTAFGFKAGIGTSSRLVAGYTVGVLVLANFGRRGELRLNGLRIPHNLSELAAAPEAPTPSSVRPPDGSVVIVMATDAPLDARQLERVSKRAAVGLARLGTALDHGSGDFVVAFTVAGEPHGVAESGEAFAALLRGVAEATEESVWNALFVAPTVLGRDDYVSPALPVNSFLHSLRAHCGE